MYNHIQNYMNIDTHGAIYKLYKCTVGFPLGAHCFGNHFTLEMKDERLPIAPFLTCMLQDE